MASIPTIPNEGDTTFPDLNTLQTTDLVGGGASGANANRQPESNRVRSNTLRDRVNALIPRVNALSDGVGSEFVMMLDGSKAMAANMSLGSKKITDLADPTAAQDGATKAYVDAWDVTVTRVIHVSQGGDDTSGTGNAQQPYATVTKAITLKAASGATAIHVHGTVTDSVVLDVVGVGQSDLSFIGDGVEVSKITSATTPFQAGATTTTSDNIVIINLTLESTSTATGSVHRALRVFKDTGGSVQNWRLQHVRLIAGVQIICQLFNGTGADFSNWRVQDVELQWGGAGSTETVYYGIDCDVDGGVGYAPVFDDVRIVGAMAFAPATSVIGIAFTSGVLRNSCIVTSAGTTGSVAVVNASGTAELENVHVTLTRSGATGGATYAVISNGQCIDVSAKAYVDDPPDDAEQYAFWSSSAGTAYMQVYGFLHLYNTQASKDLLQCSAIYIDAGTGGDELNNKYLHGILSFGADTSGKVFVFDTWGSSNRWGAGVTIRLQTTAANINSLGNIIGELQAGVDPHGKDYGEADHMKVGIAIHVDGTHGNLTNLMHVNTRGVVMGAADLFDTALTNVWWVGLYYYTEGAPGTGQTISMSSMWFEAIRLVGSNISMFDANVSVTVIRPAGSANGYGLPSVQPAVRVTFNSLVIVVAI